jgi:hypothetical protein
MMCDRYYGFECDCEPECKAAMINQAWVRIEALRVAKIAVKADIRAKGLNIKNYEAAEISELARHWFSQHQAELIGQATIALLFANITTSAQKARP